jgi:hypothetical protein
MIWIMDKKQKEALVLALLEKGESYRDIAQKAKVSPNTIKAISNRAGLDKTTSISSRAFELYSQQSFPSPLIAAIQLGLKTEEAIRYHQEYFMLLGLTEFTKIYIQIKDNPWPYVNLVNLFQKARIGEGEVVELLKIANGYLPRVRLEYDRLNEEINLSKAELNSWKAATINEVRLYQDFCDRNLALKKREDELQLSISKLDTKKAELQNTGLGESLSEFQGNKTCNTNVNLEVEQKEVIPMNDVFISPPNRISSHPNENEMLYSHSQVGPSSRTLVFDTKDLF